MLTCDNCGNDFEEGICSDCEIELRAEVQKAAKRTPLELAAGDLFNACKYFLENLDRALTVIPNKETANLHKLRKSECVLKIDEAVVKAQGSLSLQANPAAEDVEQI